MKVKCMNPVNDINQIYDDFRTMQQADSELMREIEDHNWELIHDAIEGTSPCCGSDVSLGHCHSCGEPTDPITEDEI
jgi:hypothetical protein